MVPAKSANVSVVVVLVVQPPDFVVERVVVVETGPVGLSLAETVTVLEVVHVRRLQLSSGICVAPKGVGCRADSPPGASADARRWP